MTHVFLGLGSNLGDREEHLAQGLRGIEELGELRGVSGVYETAPEGDADQPPFLNMVARLETPLQPEELLECTRHIERERGRVRTVRNAPRTLDIDVLLYEDTLLDLEELSVPHPRMTGRAFVLVPLLELAPGLRDPRTGRPYRAYLEELVAGPRESEAGDVGEVGDVGDLGAVGDLGEVEALADLGVRRVRDGEELLDDEAD